MKTKQHSFKLQVKALSEDGTFEGYGSIFNNQDYGGDIVAPGAFKRTLEELSQSGRALPMLWQHDSDHPIGACTDLKEDSRGLFFKGSLLLDVQRGAEAYALLKRGIVSGLSIGYVTKTYEIDEADDKWTRTLLDVDLFEISLVTFPMNNEARVSQVKRKIEGGQMPSLKQFEAFLRDAGFSKTHATAIASRGLKSVLRSESAENGEAKQIADLLQTFTLKT